MCNFMVDTENYNLICNSHIIYRENTKPRQGMGDKINSFANKFNLMEIKH